MSGFTVFLRKEILEIRRTWRLWGIPGILLFIAVTSPILARVTPALVRSLATDQPGVIIELPDPVPLDAYRQYVSQLVQVALLGIIIATAGMVSGEARSGTAILVLTKPLSRAAFILAKVVAQAMLVTPRAVVASIICWVGTLAIFGEAPLAELASATGIWIAVAWFLICMMALLSVVFPAQVGAAGVGIALYFVLTILSQWGPAKDLTPAGLFSAVNDVIDGDATAVAIPMSTNVVCACALLGIAIWRFNGQELTGRSST